MTSPNTLASNLQALQIQQDPKSSQESTSSTPNSAAIPIHAEQQPYQILPNNPVSLPTTFTPPSTSDDQQSAQHTVQAEKGSPYVPVTLPSNQPPIKFDQQIEHDQKPMITPTAGHSTQPEKSLPFGTLPIASPTSVDQKIGHNPSVTSAKEQITQPEKSMVPNNPFSSSSNFDPQTGHHQTPSMVIPSKGQINHPDKSSPFGQFNAPSNQPTTNFYHQIEPDKKPGHSKVHQSNEGSPNYQFNTPSKPAPTKPAPTSLDQNYQTPTTSMVISSSNDSQDISPHNFPSAVPPLLIPLSKLGQYLPEGVVMHNNETWIPLALKPLIVVKDQVAMMVFEQDNG